MSVSSELELNESGATKALVNSVTPKKLSFVNIDYSVKVASEDGKDMIQKKIVLGVSGEVVGGNMMCVLGPSGSGKTSLVHIISGRIKSTNNDSHKVGGSVLVDNETITGTAFRHMSGLVTQEDVFNSVLTVAETLTFAAALTLPEEIRAFRVEEVIRLLQLEKCRDTYIGDDSNPYMKGISGGEKRRLAIALEILDPSISFIMLDEPTSGLDAAAAQNVVNVLRTLADSGIAVLATLHQPRGTIMSQFDSIMVLADGKPIYCGPRVDYVPYLTNTLQATIPEHESPYDLLLDALNPAIKAQAPMGVIEKGYEGKVSDILNEKFVASSLGQSLIEKNEKVLAVAKTESIQSSVEQKSLMENFIRWCSVTWVILYRTSIIKLRDPICLATQLSSGIIMGLIFGALYFDVYDKSTVSFTILDTQMCISWSVLMSVWLPYDVTLTFPVERRIFLRERKAGLYSTSSFFIARIAADMPTHIISALLLAIIVWSMAKLHMPAITFIGICVAGILNGAAMMQLIGAISRTFEEANIYMMVVLMLSMMLGTSFVREVPGWLGWCREVSMMGITSDIAQYEEFKDINPKYGLTPKEVFSDYGIQITNNDQLQSSGMILLYIFIICRVLCYFAVKFMYTGRTWEEDWAD